jgi:hypothetical protein
MPYAALIVQNGGTGELTAVRSKIGLEERLIKYTTETSAVELRYDRNFDTLLFDSIESLLKSTQSEFGDEFRATLARSSIVMSLLLLELRPTFALKL